MHIVYVNGYGIPQNIEKDMKYRFYISYVLKILSDIEKNNPGEAILVCFVGGSTNSHFPDRTEAGEMERLFNQLTTKKYITEVLVENCIDVRSNLVCLRTLIPTVKSQLVRKLTLCCEYSRQDYMNFLARKIFGHVRIVGIHFDSSKNRYIQRIKKIPRTILAILGWYFPWIRQNVELKMRKRFVAKWNQSTKERPDL